MMMTTIRLTDVVFADDNKNDNKNDSKNVTVMLTGGSKRDNGDAVIL